MRILLLTFLFSIGAQASECVEFQRFYGVLNLEKKTWETMRVDENKNRICEKLFESEDSNIEIKLLKGDKTFSVKVYRNMFVHFDRIEKDKTVGGKIPGKLIAIDSMLPAWSKDSIITLTEISSGKILAKGKL